MNSDIKVLEDQFDEIIVDLATKRKQYPRKILECVIKIIKAQQEILEKHSKCIYFPVSFSLLLPFLPAPTPLHQKTYMYAVGGSTLKGIIQT
ncbi:hypothetical protein FD755_024883 [Muntiacus reevesi]|uniref:Uncharacterized protein n=1 Tax=Muntiacus reevesi TaxID=9886 RepID=A0A5N3USL9_MUNRE|nr:hypothetical protein FD755_024883 [Muntiacus reevesi]